MGASEIISLLGGIALFLFGMAIMGDGLKKVAGSKLELVLYKLTSTPLKGVLLGTGVTAVIQSSSATSVMVVGFVNSGMMKVNQAIGIVMGAILGTSVTGWILCLSSLSGGSGWVTLLSTATLTGLVAVVGILAAIALPAYQDYTLRAQATAAISQAQALQPQVVEFLDAQGRCPTNDDTGFDDPARYTQGALADVTFGEFEGSDLCGLQATLATPGKPALDGQRIWLEYDPASTAWQCSSEIEDKHLPAFCRG